MKKTLLTFCAAFFIFSVQAQESKATSLSDVLNAIIGKVTKMTSEKSVQEILCKKASIWSGTITGRSGGGIACKSSTNFAALMHFACSGYDDFDGSSCAGYIKDKFGSDADAAKVIKDVIANDKEKLAAVACTAAKFVPQLQTVAGAACVAAGA